MQAEADRKELDYLERVGAVVSVDSVREHEFAIFRKLRDNLIDHADNARLSKVLVTLKCDGGLPEPLDALELQGIPEAPLRAFLASVEVRAPRVPVLGNADASPYPSEPDAIRDRLARQRGEIGVGVEAVVHGVDVDVVDVAQEPAAGSLRESAQELRFRDR